MASDILFLSETHTSYADTITCEGYKWFFFNGRSNCPSKKRGGLAVFIKGAILGELELYPLSLNALKSSVGYWLHILNVNDNNLIFHSYKDNLLIKDGLFIKLKRFLEVIGFGHMG